MVFVNPFFHHTEYSISISSAAATMTTALHSSSAHTLYRNDREELGGHSIRPVHCFKSTSHGYMYYNLL